VKAKTPKPLTTRVTRLFKPWIVRRPDGGCQVLFPLSELDRLVDETIAEVKSGETSPHA
jgi:hypothetical protein